MRNLVEKIMNTAQTPKKFWMVFNMPNLVELDEHDAATLDQLKDGVLHGVKGISGSREIMMEWFGTRNAVLVMGSDQLIAENDIEKIHYDDPDYLCANNMKALYRLWDKRNNHQGFMQNLAGYTFKKLSHDQNYWLSYYGLESWAGDTWKGMARPQINSFDDLVRIFPMVLVKATEHLKYKSDQERIVKLIQEIDFAEPLREALTFVGKIYSSEDEWMLHNEQLIIPQKSMLLIAIEPVTFGEVLRGEIDKTSMEYQIKKYRYERAEGLLENIKKYKLAQRYTIKFIDREKFEDSRGRVMTNRRNKS